MVNFPHLIVPHDVFIVTAVLSFHFKPILTKQFLKFQSQLIMFETPITSLLTGVSQMLCLPYVCTCTAKPKGPRNHSLVALCNYLQREALIEHPVYKDVFSGQPLKNPVPITLATQCSYNKLERVAVLAQYWRGDSQLFTTPL